MIEFFGDVIVDDIDEWSYVETPPLPTTSYPDVNEYFYWTMYAGMYCIDPDYIDYVAEMMDAYYDSGTYFQDLADNYLDGWMIGLFLYQSVYSWDPSESFGACIGFGCGGMWPTEYYDTDAQETYYYFQAINFYYSAADQDESNPSVPY